MPLNMLIKAAWMPSHYKNKWQKIKENTICLRNNGQEDNALKLTKTNQNILCQLPTQISREYQLPTAQPTEMWLFQTSSSDTDYSWLLAQACLFQEYLFILDTSYCLLPKGVAFSTVVVMLVIKQSMIVLVIEVFAIVVHPWKWLSFIFWRPLSSLLLWCMFSSSAYPLIW